MKAILAWLLRLFSPEGHIAAEGAPEKLPPMKDIYAESFHIAWPGMVEGLFVGLVSLVDTMMVSGLGTTAVAAVGLTNQPKFIIMAFAMALNTGAVAVIARRIGERRLLEASRCLKQVLVLCVLISAITASLSFIFARPYLMFAGAKADTIDLAVTYFRYVIPGLFFQNLTLTINAAQRCTGNSKLSMYTNLAGNVVNIVLNYLLIHGRLGFPAWGVKGAAIATAIGSMVGFGISIRSLFHRDCVFVLSRASGRWRPEGDMWKSLWQVSSSSLFEHICMRIGFFIYSVIVANLGTTLFAIHQICMNVTSLLFTSFDGIMAASAALAGRELGAKQPRLSEGYVFACQRISLLLGTVMTILLVVFRHGIMGMFSADTFVIVTGGRVLLIVAACTHVQGIMLVHAGALRGAGDTKFVAKVALLSIAVIRPIVSWVLCYPVGLSIYGPWIGLNLDFYLRGYLNTRRFKQGNWKRIQL